MSPNLRQFYRDYLAWVESGERSDVFTSNFGLCWNLNLWGRRRGLSTLDREELPRELTLQFVAAGLPGDHPFNSSSLEYDAEPNKTLNPKRIAWVREHAQGE